MDRIATLIVFLLQQASAGDASSEVGAVHVDTTSGTAASGNIIISAGDFDEHRKTLLDMCDVLRMNAAH